MLEMKRMKGSPPVAKAHQAEDRFVLVAIGEILWDIFPDGRRIGGAPANFAYYVQALGERGVTVSKVGKDIEGEEILTFIREAGLEIRFIGADEIHPAGRVTVRLDGLGVPRFTIHDNAAWDHLALTPEILDLAGRADAVCFGTLAQRSDETRKTVRLFLRHTQERCLRILDINLRQSDLSAEIIEESLRLSRVLKLNYEELNTVATLFGWTIDETRVISLLFRRFPLELIALTRGDQGSRLYTREAFSDCPAEAVIVVDTVGAGDSFTAAVAIGMLRRECLDEINRRANRVAGFVCSKRGAWTELPGDVI
jgi:fructokinase